MDRQQKPLFTIVDTLSGRTADPASVIMEPGFIETLVWSDPDGFLIDEYGCIYLADSCGNFVECDPERFILKMESRI